MCQQVLVLLAVAAGYAGADELCCMEKSVGGLNYTLVEVKDNTFCSSDCIYERADMPGGNRTCFEAGPLTVVCYEEADIDATGLPIYHNFKYKGTRMNPAGGMETDTYPACRHVCELTEGCKVWSWYKVGYNYCYLYALDEGLERWKHFVSGVV
eukprot:GFUD01110055.1.p1 GENE.GFUD01110055.1~~GFUD01110055.1.p1  ORF type:complete len:154 (-),score=13.80 GFUD01110055.1:130-591(-)